MNDDPCYFELRLQKQECICSGARHNMWQFGTPLELEIDSQDKIGQCLCCETLVYKSNKNMCHDCGCILCHKCFVRGRYDGGELSNIEHGSIRYCYLCRRFGYLKNELYWTSNAEHLWVNANDQRWSGTSHIEISICDNETIENWSKRYCSNEDWQQASWYY